MGLAVMYHPYLRGKQYELITVREKADLLAETGFVPIIEPVKESLGGLGRTLETICDANGRVIVIVNPHHGDHKADGDSISSLLREFLNAPKIAAGVLLKKNMNVAQALECCTDHAAHEVVLIHAGFTDAKGLAEGLGDGVRNRRHVFFEGSCGKLYRKHFTSADRTLLRDGFEKRRNRDHPVVESFSDLHVTYAEEGMSGFGDFLIVGDDFSEGGGPAYAVAIHLTFIDPTQDDAMFIYHFVSERQNTPTDPAGKFGEALDAMMRTLNAPNSHIFESSAVRDLRDFHAKGHFPGLGYVKKLSMNHHIETLANYFARR